MALEIERRFLVCGDGWHQESLRHQPLRQGYLVPGGGTGVTVRVRLAASGAWLTLKAPAGDPRVRHEFEWPLPLEEAEALLALSPHALLKTRHHLQLTGGDWVVDVFEGANAPLVLAEVELPDADAPLELPPWCGREITGRGELSNAALAVRPLAAWPDAERLALLVPDEPPPHPPEIKRLS
ncbi:MAG: CYTH domain-containing protein [Synechococcus sp.]